MNSTEGKDKLLRQALRANAIFSGVSGVVFIFGYTLIASAFGLAYPQVLLIIGIALILFSWSLFRLVSQREISKPVVWSIIGGDIGWVVASAVIILMFPQLLNATGRFWVIGIAILVFTFAEFQTWGLWKIQKKAG